LAALRVESERDGAVIAPTLALAAWQEVAHTLGALAPAASRDDAKALVGALRQQGLCTLDEAHALIDLHTLATRLMAEPDVAHHGGESTRQVIVRAEQAVTRIVRTATTAEIAAPLHAEYARAAAPPPPLPPPSGSADGRPFGQGTAASSDPALATPVSASARATGRSSAFVVALVVVCLAAAGVAAFLFAGVGRRDPLGEGIAAYQAGQRMVARLAFERALADDPSDARPLIYLGRLAREDGDVAQARRLLEQAVQRAPDNALTHRELASALLADGQPELARRFYVRALEIDPSDRLAQGFLGCALARLGRVDEARRWLDRAGPGDWTACATLPPRAPGTP
jgi:tetratricopeptide (TPR) repeat protein